jgi:hypothetical protein
VSSDPDVLDDKDRLVRYAEQLQQDVFAAAEVEGSESLRAQAFTERMISELCDLGDLDDGLAVYHRTRGLEASGYSVSDDGTTIDLFVTIYTGLAPPVAVPKADLEAALKRLASFADKAMRGYHAELEEASPVFDMCLRLYEVRESVRRLRMFCFTDGIASAKFKVPSTSRVERSVHIWDIQRLYRSVTSGARQDRIRIDLALRFGGSIPCLRWNGADAEEYETYLAIVPGRVLASVYGEFGPRLLEQNVRAFLQARGKVNRGIRRTVLQEPLRFLAFNNGISATASEVETEASAGGATHLKSITDFQVVNGGQTTASLYHAAKNDGASLDDVYVQMKLTVAPPQRLDAMVPLIARYANTQNKVNEADFAASDTFHVQLQELSRTVWAPASSGAQRMTKWFYERARGQYQDELSRSGTPARREQFKSIYPTDQKFTKTDLAKFENTWRQLPYVVSLGAEKNFREFVIRQAETGRPDVDEAYFQELIAKAILFRQTEQLVGALKLGGYRANVVAYTLAFINRRTEGRLDLARIWRTQALSGPLASTISKLAPAIFDDIVAGAAGRNVTEWCKRVECWERVSRLPVDVPDALRAELIQRGVQATESRPTALTYLAKVHATPPATWNALARWARETGHLMPWKRDLAARIGQMLSNGHKPSATQAIHGVQILDEAIRMGFAPD